MDVIYFPNRNAARKDLTLAAASDLKAIGIQINPVAKDSSAVTGEVYNSTPVMLGGGGEPYTIDGQIYHILHSKYAADGASERSGITRRTTSIQKSTSCWTRLEPNPTRTSAKNYTRKSTRSIGRSLPCWLSRTVLTPTFSIATA